MVYQTSEKVKIVESNAISEQNKICRNAGSTNPYSASFLIAGPIVFNFGAIKDLINRSAMVIEMWIGKVLRLRTNCAYIQPGF